MAKTNTTARRKSQILTTHEGAPVKRIDAEAQLRRSVMACLLWESEFYESGVKIADRIADLCDDVAPDKIAAMAVEARTQMYLRHVPLWLTRLLAQRVSGNGRRDGLVSSTLQGVIQRADELTEFLALYWKDGKQPLSAQVKKGLAAAFQKFTAYDLAKYNRDGAVKLRDVLFLTHPKPKDEEQAEVWRQLIDGTLPAPDTWEVELSAGKDKRATWERLIAEKKLGGLALLRNLRNMQQVGVPDAAIKEALNTNKYKYVLPFRFVAAAKYAPKFEPELEAGMFRSLAEMRKFGGKTAILVDVSGSMQARLSEKSEMTRQEAGAALAIMARELSDDCIVIVFGTNAVLVPVRKGFALRDAITHANDFGAVGHGTNIGFAVQAAKHEGYDRIFVITDAQSHDAVAGPGDGKRGYIINTASCRNGIGYGPWTQINGWSDATLKYAQECEG